MLRRHGSITDAQRANLPRYIVYGKIMANIHLVGDSDRSHGALLRFYAGYASPVLDHQAPAGCHSDEDRR
jgi:hypothetical protein